MKGILYFVITVTIFCGCQDEILSPQYLTKELASSVPADSSNYYWCDGEKIPLTVNENKLYILTNIKKTKNIHNSIITSHGDLESTMYIEIYTNLGIKSSQRNSRQRDLTSFILNNPEQNTINEDDVVYSAPYFRTRDGAELGITNVFSVQLTEEHDFTKLQEVAKEYNITSEPR